MDELKFHTQDMPEMAHVGARYVVVAYCGSWRDGVVTNSKAEIPSLQRELRKRFMNRLDSSASPAESTLRSASFRLDDKGELKRI